jgi:hypothetical protein
MSLPPSSSLLPGLQWIPGVNATEVQQSSGLQIDAKTLNYTTYTEITIAGSDLWKAVNGLLGLTNDKEKNRYYLGAPHPSKPPSFETSYSISSLDPDKVSAEEFRSHILGHWEVENCLHGVNDKE